MKQKIIKTGNSLVVVIPSNFVKSTGIKKGDVVNAKTNIAKCKITYTFSGYQQLSLEEDLTK